MKRRDRPHRVYVEHNGEYKYIPLKSIHIDDNKNILEEVLNRVEVKIKGLNAKLEALEQTLIQFQNDFKTYTEKVEKAFEYVVEKNKEGTTL